MRLQDIRTFLQQMKFCRQLSGAGRISSKSEYLFQIRSPMVPLFRRHHIKASGFIYVVSVYGITGQRSSFEDYSSTAIHNVKHAVGSQIPVAVGFGISSPSHIKPMLRAGADAIIVGSAIVGIIKNFSLNKRKMLQQVELFVRNMKKACRQKYLLR